MLTKSDPSSIRKLYLLLDLPPSHPLLSHQQLQLYWQTSWDLFTKEVAQLNSNNEKTNLKLIEELIFKLISNWVISSAAHVDNILPTNPKNQLINIILNALFHQLNQEKFTNLYKSVLTKIDTELYELHLQNSSKPFVLQRLALKDLLEDVVKTKGLDISAIFIKPHTAITLKKILRGLTSHGWELKIFWHREKLHFVNIISTLNLLHCAAEQDALPDIEELIWLLMFRLRAHRVRTSKPISELKICEHELINKILIEIMNEIFGKIEPENLSTLKSSLEDLDDDSAKKRGNSISLLFLHPHHALVRINFLRAKLKMLSVTPQETPTDHNVFTSLFDAETLDSPSSLDNSVFDYLRPPLSLPINSPQDLSYSNQTYTFFTTVLPDPVIDAFDVINTMDEDVLPDPVIDNAVDEDVLPDPVIDAFDLIETIPELTHPPSVYASTALTMWQNAPKENDTTQTECGTINLETLPFYSHGPQ